MMPTEPGLMRLAGSVIPLLGILLATYLWKKPLEEQDPFYSRQAWSLGLAVLFLVTLDGINFVVGVSLLDRGIGFYRLGGWLGVHLVPVLWIILFFWYVRQPVTVVGLDKHTMGSGVSRGAMWVLGLLCLSWLLLSTTGGKNWAADSSKAQAVAGYAALHSRSPGWASGLYWFQAVWMAVFVGVTEEIAYRGILYGALRKLIYAPAAKALNALCFAAAHGELNPLFLLFGWLTASLTEKYRSLIPAIVIHVVWNFSLKVDPWLLGVMHVEPRTYFFVAAAVAGGGWFVAGLLNKSFVREETRMCPFSKVS